MLDWHESSNTLVALAVDNEVELFDLVQTLRQHQIQHRTFYEPDLGFELTSVAILPDERAGKLLSSLPLVGSTSGSYVPENLSKRRRIVREMEACEQMRGLSVLEHGIAVRDRLFDLLDYLQFETDLTFDWRLPDWVETYRSELIEDLGLRIDRRTLDLYTVFHDCGKPRCRTVDEAGRHHFPNHAQVSYETWMEGWGDPEVGELILHDMDVHVMKAADVESFCELPGAPMLLLTALAEVHANADMFGGPDSISFKIKWKQIKKRGRAACKHLWGEK